VTAIDRTISIAPMLDWTDRHDRYFLRLISKHALLFTEMVTTHAILNGDREYLIGYSEQEHPVVLQLGGSHVADLVECAKIAEDYGYDEVNLNVGCPSDRVQSGRFGACLMKEPDLVAECLSKMQHSVSIPVTVKSRIGVDDFDSWEFFYQFVEKLLAADVQHFYIHARKAWLSGLSPKENRQIPELKYDFVYRIKKEFPNQKFYLNGGVSQHEQVKEHLQHVDGVMIGREAYQNPYWLSCVDREYYGDCNEPLSREQIVEAMVPYIERHMENGGKLNNVSKHMLGLFQGLPGARRWRRHLSENAHKKDASIDILYQAIEAMKIE